MENNSKFKLSSGDEIIEFEGSELFVRDQIEKFFELIQNAFSPIQPHSESKITAKSSGIQNLEKVDTNNYERVFALNEEKKSLNIIAKIPGETNREKTINIALLLLFGYEKYYQRHEVSYSEIRSVCEDHSCLDDKNFSGHIKSANNDIQRIGEKRKNKAKLTFPGKEKAKSLISELLDD